MLDFETVGLLNKIFCSKYVWNHGIIKQEGELLLFPFSVEAKDACQNDQYDMTPMK